jgi:hypothetical protein
VSYPGCWWETEPVGKFHIQDVVYYPYTLVTKYVTHGADIIKTKVTDSEDKSFNNEKWAVKSQRVWSIGLKTKDGKLNIIIVSDSYMDKQAEIQVTGLNKQLSFKQFYVSQDKCDKIYEGEPITVAAGVGKFSCTLFPRSVTVFTEQ